MDEKELYRALGALTKDESRWEGSVPHVASLLGHGSVKIRGKALWLLGETGLKHPMSVKDAVPRIALGRIGRADFRLIQPYWEGLFRFASDGDAKVRLSFIWASENIAANTPDIYGESMRVFEKLLNDPDSKVRMEAPEIFRVLGKRRAEFVKPFIEKLRRISETDEDRVVRIHCLGAVKAAERTEN